MLSRVLSLLILVSIVSCDVHFMDCGSGSAFEVRRVEIDNCFEDECFLFIGEEKKITIYGENLEVMSTSTLSTNAGVRIRGHLFPIKITPENPCTLWSCPLTTRKERIFEGTIRIKGNSISVLGPARLEVQLTDPHDGSQVICVEVPVDIDRFAEEQEEPRLAYF